MKLKELRKKAGMTQSELDTKLGVKHNTISQWKKSIH